MGEQPEASPPKRGMDAIDLVGDSDEEPSPKRSRWALQLADTIVPKVQQMDSSSMAAIDALRVPQPAGQMELAVPQPAPAHAGLAASVEPDVQVEQPDEVSPAEDDLEEAPAPKPAGQKRRSQLAPAPAQPAPAQAVYSQYRLVYAEKGNTRAYIQGKDTMDKKWRLLAECTRLRCKGYKRLMCDLLEQIESMRYGKDKSKEWLRRMLEMEDYSYASSEDEELE